MVPYKPPKVAPLPVIDIGSGRDDAEISREIHATAIDTGFFYIANHGVPDAVIADAFAVLPPFFALPFEAKERLRRGKGRRGFEGMGTSTPDAGSPPDLKESWNVGWERDPDEPDPIVNQWPDNVPGFRDAIEAYAANVNAVGARLIRLIALALGLPADYFDDAFSPPSTALRCLMYPPQPADAQFNQIGGGAHTDFSALTILCQDDCGGLELRNLAGEWLSAQPLPRTFVVNIGDILMRWTNDRYRSSMHRVMNAQTVRSRYSMAFFYSPRRAATIVPMDQFLEPGEAPRYEPMLARDFMAMRVASSRLHLPEPLRG